MIGIGIFFVDIGASDLDLKNKPLSCLLSPTLQGCAERWKPGFKIAYLGSDITDISQEDQRRGFKIVKTDKGFQARKLRSSSLGCICGMDPCPCDTLATKLGGKHGQWVFLVNSHTSVGEGALRVLRKTLIQTGIYTVRVVP